MRLLIVVLNSFPRRHLRIDPRHVRRLRLLRVRQAAHLQLVRGEHEGVEGVLVEEHLAQVHELQHAPQLRRPDVGEEDHRVAVVLVPAEQLAEEAAGGGQDEPVGPDLLSILADQGHVLGAVILLEQSLEGRHHGGLVLVP